jgi:hypothetical protein
VVEPENRLVARALARRWEEALPEQRRLEEEYARFQRSQPTGLSAAERAQIQSLAGDLPALWQAPPTTAADRQRILRLLVEEVVVTVAGRREQTDVAIRWAGGHTSRHVLVRPVQRYEQLSGHAQLLNRIDARRKDNLSLAAVAAPLDQEGFQPPKGCQTFNGGMVARLVAKNCRSGPRPRAVEQPGVLGASAWLLSDLARQLEMPSATLHRWIRVGWVHARKLSTPSGHWVIWADADELDRMARLRTCPRGWSDETRLAPLTKPKARSDN